jgi:radical SAM protein with 4Fe4S-binding SPASM domain
MSFSRIKSRSAPDYLQFHPTLRCNFACAFCFNRGIDECADADPGAFGRIAALCRERSIGHIDMLGGEPTLHPELFSLLDTVCREGLVSTISTNGSRSERLCAISMRYDDASVRVGISVNVSPSSPVPAELDSYIRAFRPIVKAVQEMPGRLPEGLSPYVSNSGMEAYVLYKDAVEAADLAGCIPFDVFHEGLSGLRQAYPDLEGVFCQGFLPGDDEPELQEVRCPAGTTKLSVMPDGRVYPCYLFFRNPAFELGNLLTDDFEEIWEHPLLDFFRSFRGNRCPRAGCALHTRCHGGCPALAHIFYRDLEAPDPRCVRS